MANCSLLSVSIKSLMPSFTTNILMKDKIAQTLLLINGIPVTSLFVGNRSNAWAGMPIKSIARVEVIRGPGSALYGADAFSGVINIITKNHDELRGTQTGIRTGSFGTQAAWFTHGKSYNGLNIGFTLEAETTDLEKN